MPRPASPTPLIKKSINVPEPIYDKCYQLIQSGLYRNFSELVLDAIKLLLQKHQLL